MHHTLCHIRGTSTNPKQKFVMRQMCNAEILNIYKTTYYFSGSVTGKVRIVYPSVEAICDSWSTVWSTIYDSFVMLNTGHILGII